MTKIPLDKKPFQPGEIVAHKYHADKYFIVVRNQLDGSYVVKDVDFSLYVSSNEFVFMEEYLQTKQERRNDRIDDLLNE
jgi:hypothetical protein